MQAFVDAEYDRASALALASTPEGQEFIYVNCLERSEARFAIPQRTGYLIFWLLQAGGRHLAKPIFEAIATGADLSGVSAGMSCWALTRKLLAPPADDDLQRLISRAIPITAEWHANPLAAQPCIARNRQYCSLHTHGNTAEFEALPASNRPEIDDLVQFGCTLRARFPQQRERLYVIAGLFAILDFGECVNYAVGRLNGLPEIPGVAAMQDSAKEFVRLLAAAPIKSTPNT